MHGTVQAVMVRMQDVGATVTECLKMRMPTEAGEREAGKDGGR